MQNSIWSSFKDILGKAKFRSIFCVWYNQDPMGYDKTQHSIGSRLKES